MTPAEHIKAIERAVEIYSRDFAIYCNTQALTDFRVCSVSLATLQAAIQAGVGAPVPAQPIMCKPPKSWNKRGQDAYRRGWEEREAAQPSAKEDAEGYKQGYREGYEQRDAEVRGALA